MRLSAIVTLALGLALVLNGCGSDDGSGGSGGLGDLRAELQAAGLDRYLGAATVPTPQANGDWDRYPYPADTDGPICLGGTPYQVEVHHGTSNKVMLYLEGGGACWSYQGCVAVPTAKTTADPLFGLGIFDFNDPENPFADWTIVYAPYCDGSVFAGDNTADYDGTIRHHRGLRNLSAAVDIMRAVAPDPEQIVVSGSSAGGYGTFTGYGVTRIAYGDREILTLDDSGPGLQNPADTVNIELRNQNWRYLQFVPASCTNCQPQITNLIDWALQRDPTLRVALFSHLRDGVIRGFNLLGPAAFEGLLRDTTNPVHAAHPKTFKRFFINGDSHVVLPLPSFDTLSIRGTSIKSWTRDLLTDGPAWQDLVEETSEGFTSQLYGDDALWLCKPGIANDYCLDSDLDATATLPDNSTEVETFSAGGDHDFDCFYIYPTVNLSSTPGNDTDFSNVDLQLDPLLSQAARFTSICRVFAPLYRQGTIGSFGAPNANQIFNLAYGDVVEAFRHYLAQYNQGRNFVILGHSQGTSMASRLIQEEIDPLPHLRRRLISALLIGGSVAVPQGELVGGTFQNIPLCTSAEQTGCAIAYRSYADGYPPEGGSNAVGGPGMDTACTNPASLGGGPGVFSKAYFPLFAYQPIYRTLIPENDFGTPFSLYENFYAGECVADDTGHSYLKVSAMPAAGDQRVDLVPYDSPVFAPSFLGTHVMDYNFALGDMLEIVATQAAHIAK